MIKCAQIWETERGQEGKVRTVGGVSEQQDDNTLHALKYEYYVAHIHRNTLTTINKHTCALHTNTQAQI
jgi:hypothetical protein